MILAVENTAMAVIILLIVMTLAIGAVVLMKNLQKSYKHDKYLMINDVIKFETLSRMINFKLKTAKKNIYFSLILLSIDNFDQIREYIGEDGARQYIRSVIQNIHILLSKGSKIAIMDNKSEFLIYLPELYDEEALLEKAARFKEIVEKKVKVLHNIPLQKSVSVSIVSYPLQGGNLDRLMHFLYATMISQKKMGGNGILVFGADMDRSGAYVEHYFKLREAVDQNKVGLIFDPVFDVAKCKFVGVESVFIWECADGSIIDYKNMFPYIEESADEMWIGVWALEKAVMANINMFRSENFKEYFVSMPCSMKLIDNNNSGSILQDRLEKFGISPKNIVLSISNPETAASPRRLMKNMLLMQALGFKFMVDVSILSDNPVNIIEEYKIDYIKMGTNAILDKKNKSIDIIEYAQDNGKKIIAINVENKKQMESLVGKNVAYAVGPYLGSGKTKEELTALL
jgi:EAL domain-containing protein (putative c-di-GMP-specific phosphodiesterase class I)/GGDEF domain-containing protein